MKAQLLKYWVVVRASYWLWPSVMAISAIALSVLTLWMDTLVEVDWPEHVPFVYSNQPDGARALLATVAGSMITVTGITFSLTLLAVSHATSQFGPRLLTNFMRDRGNQFTLGTFIATFLYCLMVLRTVRSAEESSTGPGAIADFATAFVPHISIFVAILLTLASVGVLIYFIHHIPESIRLSNVVANVGRELLTAVETQFSEPEESDPLDYQAVVEARKLPEDFEINLESVTSDWDGYIQTIDHSGLLAYAQHKNLIIQMHTKSGDFVSNGQSLMDVYPASAVDRDVATNLRLMFASGNHRTATQNVMFLVDQLGEVIARALSPGINDPMSAMTCIDWFQSALIHLARYESPGSFQCDLKGALRVIDQSVDFREFCSRVFDQVRPYVADDSNAAISMMRMISNVVALDAAPERKQLLKKHAQLLIQAAESSRMFEPDLQKLKTIFAESKF